MRCLVKVKHFCLYDACRLNIISLEYYLFRMNAYAAKLRLDLH